jgi:16S rRNA (uracil1498-N3)-methyltransferase
LEYLSEIELYYSSELNERGIILSGEERNHAVKVMRHKIGDELHITDGKGKIFRSRIAEISSDIIRSETVIEYVYKNKNENIFFCIPKLRNPDRFEFALEKSTELGITNFIIYNAARGISKGDKKERWEKIVISAMKQSLRSFKPVLSYVNSISDLEKYSGKKIILDQGGDEFKIEDERHRIYFIFGPEGGFDSKEVTALRDAAKYRIAPNRLRSETAIIKAAGIFSR